jgi:hypothetical protein
VPPDGRPAGPGAGRDSLYAGIGGLAPVLAEIGRYRALTGVEQALVAGIVARLCAVAPTRTEPSLYAGLAGDVTALKLLTPGSERVPLVQLASLMTPQGWHTTVGIEPGSAAPATDLVLGHAGVVLAAVWAGGEHAADIATTGGQALLAAANRTEGGLDWAMLPGWPSRMPNYSHGTAGWLQRWPSPGWLWAGRTLSLPPGSVRSTCLRWARSMTAGSSFRTLCRTPPEMWSRSLTTGATGPPGPPSCSPRWLPLVSTRSPGGR